MIELKRIIAPVDDTPFDEICSFETENYVGIFVDYISILDSFADPKFLIMPKNTIEFSIEFIEIPDSLDKLDNYVYDKTDEHIIGVSTSRSLEIKIDEGK